MCYLGQLWLGEARLAHLRGLAHGDVALCQWPLGEGLGGPILADLTVWSVTLTGPLVSRATDPLPPTTARFSLHSSTTLIEETNKKDIRTSVKTNMVRNHCSKVMLFTLNGRRTTVSEAWGILLLLVDNKDRVPLT